MAKSKVSQKDISRQEDELSGLSWEIKKPLGDPTDFPGAKKRR